MRILIGCEFSGIVRDAFTKKGHDAWSCDLLETESPGKHIQGEVLSVIGYKPWDMLIVFPPCTHLCVSGARWFKKKRFEQAKAIEFVKALLNSPIEKIALENPIGVLSTAIRKPDQIIQPWEFGYTETKATCLWLKNLPLLKPTKNIPGFHYGRVHQTPQGDEQWKDRSRTLIGIAEAMASQW